MSSSTDRIAVPSISRLNSSAAKAAYADVVFRHRAPIGVVNAPGGLAIWYPPAKLPSAVGFRYARVELRDRLGSGSQFGEAVFNVIGNFVPPARFAEVPCTISRSISYDRMRRELVCQGPSESYNVLVLGAVMRVMLGEITAKAAADGLLVLDENPTLVPDRAETAKLERALAKRYQALLVKTDPRNEEREE